MEFLSIKTNALRRLANDEYRLTNSAVEDALCRACSRFRTCPKASTVRTCSEFIPVFIFADGRNLDKDVVNTLRLGKAWFTRLYPDKEVALWCKKEQRLYRATVHQLYWSDEKDNVLTSHAQHNHLGMEYSNPAVDLKSKLINLYGRNFFNNAKGLTAIYLNIKR